MEDNYESLTLTSANSNPVSDDEGVQSNIDVTTRLADFLSSALEPTKEELEAEPSPAAVEFKLEEAIANPLPTPSIEQQMETNPMPPPKQTTPPTKKSQGSGSKAELAARLKKRIEDKQQSSPPSTTTSPPTKKAKGRPSKKTTMVENNASSPPSELPEEKKIRVITRSSIGTYTPKKVFDPSSSNIEDSTSAPVSNKRKSRKKNQVDDDSEYVEGFQIVSNDSPPRRDQDHQTDPTEPGFVTSNVIELQQPINSNPALLENLKLFGSRPRSGKGTARLKASSGATFGPGVLKKAIRAMGGRATGNQIADWVIENKPDFLELFGDRKKLRYSIIGILSAKSYTTIFGKEVIVRNGVKRNEWFIENNGNPDNEEDDDKEEDTELVEEAVSGLFGLHRASPENTPTDGKPEPPSVYDYKFCTICNQGDNDDQLLLCDYCDNGFHMYCLDPPLSQVPEGTWYCKPCYHKIQSAPTPPPKNPRKKNFKKEEEDHDHIPFEDEQDETMTLPDEDADLESEMAGYMDLDPLDPDEPMEIDPSFRGKDEEYILLNSRTCEKHRRWKKKCPPNCPMRVKLGNAREKKAMKYYSEAIHNPFSHKTRVLRTLRPMQKKIHKEEEEDFMEPKQPKKKSKKSEEAIDASYFESGPPDPVPRLERTPTYIEMIEEAISTLGGQATTPAITNFMEEHHGQLLATKTKTWRNSVSGCLSTHFERAEGKDGHGRTLWTIPQNKGEKRERKSKFSSSSVVTENEGIKENDILVIYGDEEKKPAVVTSNIPKLRAPGRTTSKPKRLFDPAHVESLKSKNINSNDLFWREYLGIEYINSTHCLNLSPIKLDHSAPIYSMSWSTNFQSLATASTNGSVRIWNVSDWKLKKELKDAGENNIEEYYDAVFTSSDDYVIVAGKIKDRGNWNEDTNDNALISGCLKVYDVLAGKVVLNLSANFQEDVLCVRSLCFEGENYMVVCSQDGQIVKYKLNSDYSQVLEVRKLSNSGSGIAVTLEFLLDCGNKYFVAAFDSGIKIFDFEGELLVQSFTNLYTYLCDCVRVVKCKDLKSGKNDHFIITRGVELIDEENEVVKPNSCHLRRLILPENGVGGILLEEISSYESDYYKSNVWLMKCNSNGRYMCSPTTDGRVFVWNLRSREVAAILFDHAKGTEVRDVLFHPSKKLLLTAGDDHVIRIYTQTESLTTPPKPEEEVEIEN